MQPVKSEFAEAYVFITPPMYIATKVGELFDVAVNISNVKDLRSLKFAITYNTSLLDVAQVATILVSEFISRCQ